MPPLDLGLIDGQDWNAAGLDAVELAINKISIRGTLAARPASGGEVGSMYVDQANGRMFMWDGNAWRGMRPTSHASTSGGTGATTSGGTQATVNSLLIPDQGCAGTLHLFAHTWFTATAGADVYYVHIRDNGGNILAYDRVRTPASGSDNMAHPVGAVAITAGVANTITTTIARIAGTGTAQVAIDNSLNRIQGIFVPT